MQARADYLRTIITQMLRDVLQWWSKSVRSWKVEAGYKNVQGVNADRAMLWLNRQVRAHRLIRQHITYILLPLGAGQVARDT